MDIGRVLVLGLGKSGKSLARYCAGLIGSRVSSLFIAAGARTDDSVAFVESLDCEGVAYAFGDDALERFAGGGQTFDICIASPGIPYWHDLYVTGSAISGELISEVEFAWRESSPDSTWIAITGTNGKTTTTSCCAHVLQECGFAAAAVGNIGDVCLDAVQAGQTQVYVTEVSSYQTYSTRYFAPDLAVMLNITPDHIHWHKTFEAYRDAKFNLLDNMSKAALAQKVDGSEGRLPLGWCPRFADDSASKRILTRPIAVMDATNDVVRTKVRQLKALDFEERGFDYVPMGTAEGIHGDMRARCGADNAAFIDLQRVMHVAFEGVEHVLLNVDELKIKGAHNASNALAAAAVAVVLGADDEAISAALRSFAPLEHRIEPCGCVGGIECFNESKATNVDATLKALEAFPGRRVIALLGGDDKGTELKDLVKSSFAHASAVVCFGTAGPRFEQAFHEAAALAPEGYVVLHRKHLADALDAALSLAEAGDVVLLSPACASFDEFSSFEERGRVFKQLVAQRADAAVRD